MSRISDARLDEIVEAAGGSAEEMSELVRGYRALYEVRNAIVENGHPLKMLDAVRRELRAIDSMGAP